MKKLFLFLASALVISTAYANTDSVYVQIVGDTVMIWDRNAHENCCISVVMSADVWNDSIIVIENDTSTSYCNCMCYFDFSVSLTDLSPGTYHVSVYRRYTWFTPDSLYLIDTVSFQYGGISSGQPEATYFMSACHDPVAVKKSDHEIPQTVSLTNYPNPFNPATSIQYSLPKQQFVTLKIYDAFGREVAMLVNEIKPAGKYKIDWNTGNASSGVYYLRLNAGGNSEVRKMVVVK